jgi:cytoskeletal protein RodZ
MTLEEIGQELKKKRVERQISLMDISAETRVNLKFLEAIERGNFAILPQTYVRAMIREYAAHVGLDPVEMMGAYDLARGEKHEKHHVTSSSPATLEASLAPTQEAGGSAPLARQLLFGGIILAAIVIVVLIIRPGSPTVQPPQNPEVAFDSVIRENEAVSVKRDSITAFVPKPTPVLPTPVDSLRLEMLTRDTVWINLLIDGKRSEQYLVPPNRKKFFIAKDQFSITMGNAGGAVFSLNGKELPPLGRRGAVIRNTVINLASLKPL